MRHLKTLFAGAALVAMVQAQAVVLLDFEGIGDGASIGDFYNGGTDSAGNSGTNHGIAFTDAALGSIDADAGGTGPIENEPSPHSALKPAVGFFTYMNVAGGFDKGFSFFYSATESFGIRVYDGLDGTGNNLGSIVLDIQYNDGCAGPPGNDVCNWTPVGVTFNGVAKSVDFTTAGFVWFDNVTLGSATPVPEPFAWALMAAGLAGIGAVARRRRLTQPQAAVA